MCEWWLLDELGRPKPPVFVGGPMLGGTAFVMIGAILGTETYWNKEKSSQNCFVTLKHITKFIMFMNKASMYGS